MSRPSFGRVKACRADGRAEVGSKASFLGERAAAAASRVFLFCIPFTYFFDLVQHRSKYLVNRGRYFLLIVMRISMQTLRPFCPAVLKRTKVGQFMVNEIERRELSGNLRRGATDCIPMD